MIKKSFKILLFYIFGIFASLIISLLLGILWKLSHVAFSVITGAISIAFVYARMWNFGYDDKLNNTSLVPRAFAYMSSFIAVAVLLEFCVAICTLCHLDKILDGISLIAIIWYYPFTGFYDDSGLLVSIPVITAVVTAFGIIGYIFGTKGIYKINTLIKKIHIGK